MKIGAELKPTDGIAYSTNLRTLGDFEGLPLFLENELPVDCCVLDIANMGILNRCKLTSSAPYLKISFSSIDDKTAREIINKNPEYLKDEKGDEVPLEKAVNNLIIKIRVIALSKKDFEVQNRRAGMLIDFED